MSKEFEVPRSVEWEENRINILNQQKLPAETVFEHLYTKEDVYDAIVTLKVRGAPAIGITAAFGLALSAQEIDTEDIDLFKREVARLKEYLNSARPTAVNLACSIRPALSAH